MSPGEGACDIPPAATTRRRIFLAKLVLLLICCKVDNSSVYEVPPKISTILPAGLLLRVCARAFRALRNSIASVLMFTVQFYLNGVVQLLYKDLL